MQIKICKKVDGTETYLYFTSCILCASLIFLSINFHGSADSESVSDCCLTPIQQFFGYIMARTSYFQWDDDEVPFVLDQHAELDFFYSASSLKQQSAGRYVAPLRHIILTSSQPVFALTPQCCVLSGEATNTNFLVFGLTRPGREPTIYRTGSEHANHYTIDVVDKQIVRCSLISNLMALISFLVT